MNKSFPRIRGTTPEIEEAAIELRREFTPTEKQLWQALRARKIGGFKFRRQHPLGRFILDFYCAKCKLVIEVDGEIHHNRQDYDTERTKYLQSYGYTILRFQNHEVIQNLEQVLQQVLQTALRLSSPD
ncbi:endonuclease domain-containing protein [Calothrix sp. CCY 0018]|uniref:endonuclease domain-containing protein n=1 Tax=Calothrix sp. CCY 0018 TaxID=3103864 RepID=UPI0039C64EA1